MHLYNGIQLNNTKDKLLIHKTIWIGIKVIMLSKKDNIQGGQMEQRRKHAV